MVTGKLDVVRKCRRAAVGSYAGKNATRLNLGLQENTSNEQLTGRARLCALVRLLEGTTMS